MCGIGAIVGGDAEAVAALATTLWPSIARRGPDVQHEYVATSPSQSSTGFSNGTQSTPSHLHLLGSVLHLRGPDGEPTRQPLVDAGGSGDVLCWNGQVFGGTAALADVEASGGNDTRAILRRLRSACVSAEAELAMAPLDASSPDASVNASSTAVAETVATCFRRALEGVEGPFAIIYWSAAARTFVYGRDRLGRRSLLRARRGKSHCASNAEGDLFALASVAPVGSRYLDDVGEVDDSSEVAESMATREAGGVGLAAPNGRELLWEDVPSGGFFTLHVPLEVSNLSNLPASIAHSWEISIPVAIPTPENKDVAEYPAHREATLKKEEPETFESAVLEFVALLNDAVRKRVADVPRPPTKASATQEYWSPSEAIQGASASGARFANSDTQHAGKFPEASAPKCLDDPVNDNDCRVGVLFSGGIDCVVVAALADRHVPPGVPIELVNVSFYGGADNCDRHGNAAPCKNSKGSSVVDEKCENPAVSTDVPRRAPKRQRQLGNTSANASSAADAAPGDVVSTTAASPDRLAAIAAVAELRVLCPSREWRLVGVDVNYATDCAATDAQRAWLLSLCGPRATHMDLNIATALHFAAMGQGRLIFPPQPQYSLPNPSSHKQMSSEGSMRCESSCNSISASGDVHTQAIDSVGKAQNAKALATTNSNSSLRYADSFGHSADSLKKHNSAQTEGSNDGGSTISATLAESPANASEGILLECQGARCRGVAKAGCHLRACATCCRRTHSLLHQLAHGFEQRQHERATASDTMLDSYLVSTTKNGTESTPGGAEIEATTTTLPKNTPETTAEDTVAAAPLSKRARKRLVQESGGSQSSNGESKSKNKFSLSPEAVYAQLQREGLVSSTELEKFTSLQSLTGDVKGEEVMSGIDRKRGRVAEANVGKDSGRTLESSPSKAIAQILLGMCSVHSMKPRRAAVSAAWKFTSSSATSEIDGAKQAVELSLTTAAAVWGPAYTLNARVLLSGCVFTFRVY